MARSKRKRRYDREFQRGYRGHVGSFVRRLREQGEHVVAAAKNALKEGVDQVVVDAKSRVRVDTGRLKESIKAVDVADGAAYEIEANARNPKDHIVYGQFEEFAPWGHPFLMPALEAHTNGIIANIKQAIEDAVQRGH